MGKLTSKFGLIAVFLYSWLFSLNGLDSNIVTINLMDRNDQIIEMIKVGWQVVHRFAL